MSTERVIGLYKARLLEAACHTEDPEWAWRKWYEGKTGQLYHHPHNTGNFFIYSVV